MTAANFQAINPATGEALDPPFVESTSTEVDAAAIDAVAAFGEEVRKQSGAAIPNVWRANGGPTNVAGILRSAADTLKYSLVFKSNLTPLP
jgi:hypothetical protein